MKVEDVARIRLAAGWPAEQERHLAIGPGVLGKIVVDAQRVLHELAVDLDALLHDFLAHGAARVRGEELEGGRLLGPGYDDDRMLHRPVLLEHGHDLGDGGELLADGDVDADEALAFLVDDRIDGECALAGLTVADDQLALAASDGDQGVDGLDAGLDRRIDRLAGDDTRCDALHGAGRGMGDRTLVVQGPAERVDDTAQETGPDRHLNHATGSLDGVTLLDMGWVAENDRADGLLLKVQSHPHDATWELEQLGGEGAGEAVDLGDAVADLDHRTDAAGLRACVETFDRVLDDADDLV